MALPKLHLMLVDDHAMVRRGMASLINAEPDMHVVAEAASADEAIQTIEGGLPLDVIVVDMVLKEISDTTLIKKIAEIRPALPILVVSMHNEALYAESAIQAGASGYVMKHAPAEQLIQAIRHIIEDEIYLSPEMNALMARRLHCDSSEANPISRLTKSELAVLRLIAAGQNSVDIAQSQCRSVKTIEAHRANIRSKMGLRDSADLVRFAVRMFPPLDWGG